MENIIIIILLSILLILIISSIFIILNLKNNFKQEIENINKENDNKLNSQLKDQSFDIKDSLKENVFEIRDNLKDNMNKNIGDLNKEISENMFSNLEKTQNVANNNIKDISELISKNIDSNNEKIEKTINGLQKEVQQKLDAITDRVDNKLASGFEKSNDIFNKIINKINLIEEAQNKIEDLSKNVASLQNVLSDKQSRGAWGEVQLEQIISNIFPKNNYEKQHKLSNNNKVDFFLRIPDPSFDIAIDSKFPFENYKKMVSEEKYSFCKASKLSK